MKCIYPKTIFVDEDGVIVENNYDKTKYIQKKQWYEHRIEKGDRINEYKRIIQRFVQLEEIKTKQLKLEFN